MEHHSFPSIGAFSPEGELLGYLIYSEVADELHILNLAVHPECRKRGVAAGMLGTIHARARANGRTCAFLEVRESNVEARELYRKFGYKQMYRRREYYPGDREDAIVMTATLEPKGS